MSDTINMLDAKSSLSKLVHAQESGQASEFIIARNGRPAARVIPVEPAREDRHRRIGAARGCFLMPDDIDARNADLRRLSEGGT